MKKKRKRTARKSTQRRSLLGLFRRGAPLSGPAPDEPPAKGPEAAAGAPPTATPTLRLRQLVDEDFPYEVAKGPAAEPAEGPEPASSLAPPPVHESSDTLRVVVPRADDQDAARMASHAYRQAVRDEHRRGRPPRPPRNRRIEQVRPRRREGGFFSFLFSLIGLIIRMVVVVALVGAVGALIGYEVVRTYVRTPEVVVPNVRGMKLADAFDVLGQKKLGLLKERVEPNALVAPGEIIEQKPPPGTKAKQGTPVRVVVSSGRANYIVPDVVGERRENAENKIRGAGLEVGDITYLESDTVPRDCVISQNPEANKGLEQPAPVSLLVSKGPPKSAAGALPTPAADTGAPAP
jgi:xanthosine utilization system XapX-like protein